MHLQATTHHTSNCACNLPKPRPHISNKECVLQYRQQLEARLLLYRCCCSAAAYGTDFVATRPRPLLKKNPPFHGCRIVCAYNVKGHTSLTYRSAYICAHAHRPWLSERQGLTGRLLLYRECHKYRVWRAMCDAAAKWQGEKKNEN